MSEFFSKGIGIHIFRQMAAQASDKFIHVCHVPVRAAFLVDGTVNDAILKSSVSDESLTGESGEGPLAK